MKRFASALAVSVILMSALSVTPATAEPVTVQAPVSIPVTAPEVSLTFERVEVSTEPAPVVEAEPSPEIAPEPVVEAAPIAVPAETVEPVQEPTPVISQVTAEPVATEPVAVECLEDQPCWNCETMGNRVCGAAVTESLDDWLTRVCAGPVLGDAYAGIMRNCHWQEAMSVQPVGFVWIGSGFASDFCSTYIVNSERYEGIVHNFKDPTIPSSYEPCNYIPITAG